MRLAVWQDRHQEAQPEPEVYCRRPGRSGGGHHQPAKVWASARSGAVRRLPSRHGARSDGLHGDLEQSVPEQPSRRPLEPRFAHRPPPRRSHQGMTTAPSRPSHRPHPSLTPIQTPPPSASLSSLIPFLSLNSPLAAKPQRRPLPPRPLRRLGRRRHRFTRPASQDPSDPH